MESLHLEDATTDALQAVEGVGRSLGPEEVAMFHVTSLEVCGSQLALSKSY